MSRYDLVINGNSYTVKLGPALGSTRTVEVNGATYTVEMMGKMDPPPSPATPAREQVAVRQAPPSQPTRSTSPAQQQTTSMEGEPILAPMPGHILSVAVKVGDRVTSGDTVVVMEAMKMENDIKSHLAGTVSEVHVSPGTDVGVNAVLVVIAS